MDIAFIIFLILFALINVIARASREREKRDGEAVSPPAARPRPSTLEEFLRELRHEQSGVEIIEEASHAPAHPEPPAPEPPHIREKSAYGRTSRLSEIGGLSSGMRGKSLVADGAFLPLHDSLPSQGVWGETKLSSHLTVDNNSARKGIILAEILGPPLAKRTTGTFARRLF